jgi:glyoxylase-like metal-dependent hydrolase (beta-lactamase superfamily II)
VISPLVSRLVGKDATFRGVAGLRTYLVGGADVAVIDPDPPSQPLLEAILKATQGRRITHVILTHTHGRRSPLALELTSRTGAQLLAAHCGLVDGLRIGGSGFTLEAIATPGHSADHFALALLQEDAVFSGDLVSGWAPSVYIPPGGDLGLHLGSLERVLRRGFARLLPAHGPQVAEPGRFLAECLEVSRGRERQILGWAARLGCFSAWRLAERLRRRSSDDVDPAVAHAILAHLVWLARQGRLIAQGVPSLSTSFALTEASRAA